MSWLGGLFFENLKVDILKWVNLFCVLVFGLMFIKVDLREMYVVYVYSVNWSKGDGLG